MPQQPRGRHNQQQAQPHPGACPCIYVAMCLRRSGATAAILCALKLPCARCSARMTRLPCCKRRGSQCCNYSASLVLKHTAEPVPTVLDTSEYLSGVPLAASPRAPHQHCRWHEMPAECPNPAPSSAGVSSRPAVERTPAVEDNQGSWWSRRKPSLCRSQRQRLFFGTLLAAVDKAPHVKAEEEVWLPRLQGERLL